MKDLRVIAKIVQFFSSSDYSGITSTFCMISTIGTRILFDFAFEKKLDCLCCDSEFHQALQGCLQKGSTIYISAQTDCG